MKGGDQMQVWTLEDFDYTIQKEVKNYFKGYRTKMVSKGIENGTGKREILYQVTMKDKSTFIAIARYDMVNYLIDIVERYE